MLAFAASNASAAEPPGAPALNLPVVADTSDSGAAASEAAATINEVAAGQKLAPAISSSVNSGGAAIVDPPEVDTGSIDAAPVPDQSPLPAAIEEAVEGAASGAVETATPGTAVGQVVDAVNSQTPVDPTRLADALAEAAPLEPETTSQLSDVAEPIQQALPSVQLTAPPAPTGGGTNTVAQAPDSPMQSVGAPHDGGAPPSGPSEAPGTTLPGATSTANLGATVPPSASPVSQQTLPLSTIADSPGSAKSSPAGSDPTVPFHADATLPVSTSLFSMASGLELESDIAAHSNPRPTPAGPGGLPLPQAPDPGGSGSSGSFFFGFAALLLALLAWAAPTLIRRVQCAPAGWWPAPYVSLLERPG